MSEKWYLRTQDDTFGPETRDRLIEWARMGRIQPGQEISDDGENWKPAVEFPFLDMRWSIDIGDGTPRGPFNKHAAEALLKSGRLPPGSKLVEVPPAFEEETVPDEVKDEPSAPAPSKTAAPEPTSPQPEVKVVEKIVEVPVEVVKEVVKEVPVERIVEKEVRVEVPVEKIVEKEKVVEVESPELLARAAALEAAVVAARDEGARALSAAREEGEKALTAAREESEKALSAAREEGAKALSAAREEGEKALSAERAESEKTRKELEAAVAEAKRETLTLESEIRRLPPNAKEAADMEAAVYWLMRGEVDDLEKALATEKQEAEEAQKRWRERAERLAARRVEILKKIGDNAKDMKQRALRANPADPRTVQLRQELDALRLVSERHANESGQQIKDLTRALNEKKTEAARLAAQVGDIKRLQEQIRELREKLQLREKELLDARQTNEELRRNNAASQQALLARLSELESVLPGRDNSSSRETHAPGSRFPSWMSLKK